MDNLILTPDHPNFCNYLPKVTPNFLQERKNKGDMVMIQREGSLLLEPLSADDLDDYLYGGEYDEVMGDESGFDIEYD